MNDSFTSDDDDEENHRWFFSRKNTVLLADGRIPASRQEDSLFYSDTDFITQADDEKHQMFPHILQNCNYYGLITG